MKKMLVKLIISIYYRFDVHLRKSIPITFRAKIRYYLSRWLKSDSLKHIDVRFDMPPGVNLVGLIQSETGLGQGCRLLAKALNISGINWLAINSESKTDERRGDSTLAYKIEPEPKYNTNIIHINPDLMHLINLFLPQQLWNASYTIGVCLCELESVSNEWIVGLEFFDEIWAPSQFIVETVKRVTNKPVIKVPYGISIEDYTLYSREHFGFPKDIFLFLTMYDTYSSTDRKNPMGSILAFKEAFLPQETQVGLVLKINNSDKSNTGELSSIKDALKEYKNIFFIERTLDRSEVNSLIYCCDSIVSLHRAEGFGLVPAEAMYVGRPVISTDWSATTEFVNSSNACPVRYNLVKIEKDIGNYKAGMAWAEPDITHAAEHMRKLYFDREYYDSIASNSKAFIRSNYSHEHCADIIKSRLEELELL